MTILFAILLFSFLIFIHELGHFLAAKSFGVRVNEFALFMGPALWQKQVGETMYSLRCIPIGGYCAMEGEEGGSDAPNAFTAVSWWKRAIILVAGAAMNFLTGLVLLAVFFAPDQQFILPVVSSVEPGSSLAVPGGFEAGDRILKVDGENIYVYSDFTLILNLKEGEYHDITVERQGRKVELPHVLLELREFPDPDGTVRMRYGFDFTIVPASFLETARYVGATAMDTVRLVRLSLGMLARGQAGLKDVTGPVGIVQQMSEVAEESSSTFYAFMSMIYFGAFIAINLAVMNLLPIPALDGGRVAGLLITALIEAVTRKKLDPRYEGYVHSVGMLLLLAIMGLIMFKDIFMIFRG